MNIAYFLTPKCDVAYLYDDATFRQGLEKLRRHEYAAIPVITREGQYAGTVNEGDFLWRMLEDETFSMKDMERIHIQDILNPDAFPPVRITSSVEALLDHSIRRSFIPVIDDTGSFIGIVTRGRILRTVLGIPEPSPDIGNAMPAAAHSK